MGVEKTWDSTAFVGFMPAFLQKGPANICAMLLRGLNTKILGHEHIRLLEYLVAPLASTPWTCVVWAGELQSLKVYSSMWRHIYIFPGQTTLGQKSGVGAKVEVAG